MKTKNCPVCKTEIEPGNAGALSRVDEKTIICPDCGGREATSRYEAGLRNYKSKPKAIAYSQI